MKNVESAGADCGEARGGIAGVSQAPFPLDERNHFSSEPGNPLTVLSWRNILSSSFLRDMAAASREADRAR